jgi:hypothetical protein
MAQVRFAAHIEGDGRFDFARDFRRAVRRLPADYDGGPQWRMFCSLALARAIVDAHEHFLRRADRFEFRFRKGRLLVKGCVPSFYLKQQLQSALRDIVTYCPVDNQVSVVSGFGLSSVSALEG